MAVGLQNQAVMPGKHGTNALFDSHTTPSTRAGTSALKKTESPENKKVGLLGSNSTSLFLSCYSLQSNTRYNTHIRVLFASDIVLDPNPR
jgi:hypothetical protein